MSKVVACRAEINRTFVLLACEVVIWTFMILCQQPCYLEW